MPAPSMKKLAKLYTAPHPTLTEHPGLLEAGNIDINSRPSVPNPLGGNSSVYSTSVNFGDGEILIPRVIPDGNGDWTVDVSKNADQAVAHYKKTGEHLGRFKTVDDANNYSDILHLQQAAMEGK